MPDTDLALDILRATHDGDDLASSDLALLQMAVNNDLNDLGREAFRDLHRRTKSGYVRPWFYGIKHLTKAPSGYVYWKGECVEHYSYRGDFDAEKRAAQNLAKDCQQLETTGQDVNGSTLWKLWQTRTLEQRGSLTYA